jgi:hypothetical protein
MICINLSCAKGPFRAWEVIPNQFSIILNQKKTEFWKQMKWVPGGAAMEMLMLLKFTYLGSIDIDIAGCSKLYGFSPLRTNSTLPPKHFRKS